jgi:hypothetical protein
VTHLSPAPGPAPDPGYYTTDEIAAMRRAITVADRLDTPPGLTDEETTYRALYGAAVRLGYAGGDSAADDTGFRAWAKRVRMEDIGAVLSAAHEDEPTDDPT